MELSWQQLQRHLGQARLEQYLVHCQGDQYRAVALYRWNAQLAAAFWLDLGHLEVALRNAIDAAMVARLHHRIKRGDLGNEHDDWLDDPQGQLGRDARGPGRHRQPYVDIASAKKRVQGNQKPGTHDQVISETSFGLWHQLVSRSHMFLWPDLAGAFAYAPDRDQRTIASPIARLRTFRNRIAHHHRIWVHDVYSRHTDLITIAQYLDPALAEWITADSDVLKLLQEQP